MNTIKKNSKKGFTLVELVVVIAILAILAAIAIPVVSSTIESSQRSSALQNASTVELALKEAQAQIAAKDTAIFTDGTKTDIAEVAAKKSIANVPATYDIGGVTYTLGWCKADDKVYYTATSGGKTVNLDTNITPGGAVSTLNLKDTKDGSLMDLFKA